MLDAACNGRCGCASRTGLLVTEVSKSWRTLWKRWPIYRCVAVTNDSTENADKMSRSVERAKNTAPHPSPASGRGRVGGRHMPFARRRPCGPVLVLRAEEPRPRIADYVAPLVVERTTRPIAARTSDRISPGVGGIGNVAWRHRIGRIGRVRNRTADDGARSKATENAEPHAAAATARISVVRNGDRGKREHTCGGDSGHRCLHVLTSSGNDRVAIVRLYPGFLKPRLSIHAPVRDISDAPKPPCVPRLRRFRHADRNLGNRYLTSLANLSEIC